MNYAWKMGAAFPAPFQRYAMGIFGKKTANGGLTLDYFPVELYNEIKVFLRGKDA